MQLLLAILSLAALVCTAVMLSMWHVRGPEVARAVAMVFVPVWVLQLAVHVLFLVFRRG